MQTKTFLEIVSFSAEAHKYQQRKSGGAYINHPIRVAVALVREGVTDDNVIAAAVLHDTLEDTETTYKDLVSNFGAETADIVKELTDDKSLPKAHRKELAIVHAKELSLGARTVKLADLLDNCRGILGDHRPEGWDDDRVKGYAIWAKAVAEAALTPVENSPELYRLMEKLDIHMMNWCTQYDLTNWYENNLAY